MSFEYAPAPESRAIVDIKSSYGLFINGAFSEATDGKPFKSVSPSSEEVLAEISEAGPADVDRAVKAARKAYDKVWSTMPGRDRAKYLYRIARIIQERSRELAVLESLDNGKPIRESRDVDLPLVAAHFFYYAGWADKLGYAVPGRPARPIGVAAQVIPWNFRLLVEHPGVDKVAFTGSTEVGRAIARSVAGSHKRLTLELGGKAANIVFDDAPLDQAIEGIINGIYFNQGEVCCAGSRLFVQESVYEPLLDKLKARLSTLRVGDPLDKNTDVGAINSATQLAKVTELVESGVQEGAEIFQPDCELPTRGFFFRPTLFTGVSQSHRIAQEEIFGPVLSVLTFRTPEEAIEKANNTPYGLSAGVWTEKGSRIFKMVSAMRAGVVWANTFNRFDPTSPFGGYQESGFGREGGRHGLAAYLDLGGERGRG